MPRSWTGEALIPVLESDPYVKRKVYDPSKDDRWNRLRFAEWKSLPVGKAIRIDLRVKGDRLTLSLDGKSVLDEGAGIAQEINTISHEQLPPLFQLIVIALRAARRGSVGCHVKSVAQGSGHVSLLFRLRATTRTGVPTKSNVSRRRRSMKRR